MTNSSHANGIIEKSLHASLDELAKVMESDIVAIYSPIFNGLDDIVKKQIESISPRREKIAIVLETEGGVIQVAERIATVIRHHYPIHVAFIVPNFAMSAGTVLVMCGDEIWMDYYSVLGPIDPQVRKGDRYVPALGYLEQYNRLSKAAAAGQLTTADIVLLEKLDLAELYQFDQAKELSISLLKEWLVKYKFKDWKKTQTNGKRVTAKMRQTRAVEIASKLSDTKKWHSHGRGISKDVLINDINLLVNDFGLDNSKNSQIRAYTQLLLDYMQKRDHSIVCHVSGSYLGIGR